ncbi:MAG: autotransporter-associated beta strand repeat-containing protein [Tepidisphaeraceae bacterium]
MNENYWIDSLRFTDDSIAGESSFTINNDNGAILLLAGGVYNYSSKTQVVNVPLSLTGSSDIKNANSSADYGPLTVSGSISMGNSSLYMTASPSNIALSGSIAGTGALYFQGSGTTALSGSNTITGPLIISGGTLSYGAGPNLGSPLGGIEFNDSDGSGGTLLRTGSGTTLRPIQFTHGEGRLEVPSGVTVTYSGYWSGTTRFAKTGPGTIILDGNAGIGNPSYPFTGATDVRAGTLQILSRARLASNDLTVYGNASLVIGDGLTESVTTLNGGGTISFGNGGGLTVGAVTGNSTNGSGNFTGTLAGNNITLTKRGAGTLTLSGNNAYSGSTAITAGTVVANNTLGSATGTGAVTISGTGILAGTGTLLGAVSASDSAQLTPGAVGPPANTVGMLTVGHLSLQSSTSVAIELTPVASDKLTITGNASLAGTLALSRVNNDAIAYSTPREILRINGTRAGVFDTVTGNQQSLTSWFAITYSGPSVLLSVARPGDADLDGRVNFNDLLALAAHYSAAGQTWATGDFDGTGNVNFSDLLTLARNYGFDTTGTSASDFATNWAAALALIPEPTLWLVSPLLALGRRRRGC